MVQNVCTSITKLYYDFVNFWQMGQWEMSFIVDPSKEAERILLIKKLKNVILL